MSRGRVAIPRRLVGRGNGPRARRLASHDRTGLAHGARLAPRSSGGWRHGMTPGEYEHLSDAFTAISQAAPAERQQLLDDLAHADAGLLARVESLLAADAADNPSGPGLFDTPLLGSRVSFEDWTAQPPLPERINRYRVLRQLGEGSMGVVYEAQQESPPRRVA